VLFDDHHMVHRHNAPYLAICEGKGAKMCLRIPHMHMCGTQCFQDNVNADWCPVAGVNALRTWLKTH